MNEITLFAVTPQGKFLEHARFSSVQLLARYLAEKDAEYCGRVGYVFTWNGLSCRALIWQYDVRKPWQWNRDTLRPLVERAKRLNRLPRLTPVSRKTA